MIERKDKTLNPTINIVNKKGEQTRSYSIPVKLTYLLMMDKQLNLDKSLPRFQDWHLL